MFCSNCGTNCPDNVNNCPNCGAPVGQPQQPSYGQQPSYVQAPYGQQSYGQSPYGYQPPKPVDKGSIGWGFLGFCIPLVGLILFLVWKDSKPVSSKQAGIGALIGFGLNLLSTVLMYVIGIAASM